MILFEILIKFRADGPEPALMRLVKWNGTGMKGETLCFRIARFALWRGCRSSFCAHIRSVTMPSMSLIRGMAKQYLPSNNKMTMMMMIMIFVVEFVFSLCLCLSIVSVVNCCFLLMLYIGRPTSDAIKIRVAYTYFDFDMYLHKKK